MKRVFLLFLMACFGVLIAADPVDGVIALNWKLDSWPDNMGIDVRGDKFFTSTEPVHYGSATSVTVKTGPRPLELAIKTLDSEESGFFVCFKEEGGEYKKVSDLINHCEIIIEENYFRIKQWDLENPNQYQTSAIPFWDDVFGYEIIIGFFKNRKEYRDFIPASDCRYTIDIEILVQSVHGDIAPELFDDGKFLYEMPDNDDTYFFRADAPRNFQIKEAPAPTSPYSYQNYEIMESNLWNFGWKVSDDAVISESLLSPLSYRYSVTPSLLYPTVYSLKLLDEYGNEKWDPLYSLCFYPDPYPPYMEGEFDTYSSLYPDEDYYSQSIVFRQNDSRDTYDPYHNLWRSSPGSGAILPVLKIPDGASDLFSLEIGELNGSDVTYEFLVERGLPLEGVEVFLLDRVGNQGDPISLDDQFYNYVPRCQFDDSTTKILISDSDTATHQAPYVLEYGILVGKNIDNTKLGVRMIHLKNVSDDYYHTIYSYNPAVSAIPGLRKLPENSKYDLLTGSIHLNEAYAFIDDYDTASEKEFDLAVILMSRGMRESAIEAISLKIPDIPVNVKTNEVLIALCDDSQTISLWRSEQANGERVIYTNHDLTLKLKLSSSFIPDESYFDINKDPLKLKQHLDSDNFITSRTSITIDRSVDPGDIVLLECREEHHIDHLPDVEYPLNFKVIYDTEIRKPDEDLFSIYAGQRELTASGNVSRALPDWIRIKQSVFEDWNNSDTEELAGIEIYLEHPRTVIQSFSTFQEFLASLKTNEDPSLGVGFPADPCIFPELGEGDYKIQMCVTDLAGNSNNEFYKEFKIDRSPIDLPDSLIEDNLIRVEGGENPLTAYDYDWETRVLTFSISTHPCYWAEELSVSRIELQGLENYDFINLDGPEPLKIYRNDAGQQLHFSFQLADLFPSNRCIQPILVVYDPAGNQSTLSLRLYTPAHYSTFYDAGLIPDPLELGPDGKARFSWIDEGVVRPGSLKLYRKVEGGELLPLNFDCDGFSDSNLLAHGEYSYRLSPVNGSNFESTFGGYTDFPRRVLNNPPLRDEGEFFSFSISKGGFNFIGPDCEFTSIVSDVDGDELYGRLFLESLDRLNSYALTPKVLLEGGDFTYNFSQLTESEKGGDEFLIRFEYQDFWLDEGGEENLGEVQRLRTEALRYDSRGPSILILPDKRPGYRSGFDGFTLETGDDEVGLAESEISIFKVAGEDEPRELTILNVSEESFHYSFVDEGRYDLQVIATDRLGNSNLKEFTGLDIDFTAPEILSGYFSAGTEGPLHLRSPNLPWTIHCEDNFTGFNTLLFRLYSGEASEQRLILEKESSVFIGIAASEGESEYHDVLAIPDSDQDPATPLWAVWQVTDNSGNVSGEYSSLPRCVYIDTEAPIVSIDASGFSASDDVVFANGRAYVTDTNLLCALREDCRETHPGENSGWRLKREPSDEEALFPPLYMPLEDVLGEIESDGDYALIFGAEDRAGNRSETPPYLFTLDTTAPVLIHDSITEFPAEYRPGEVLQIPLSGRDATFLSSFYIKVGHPGADGAFLSKLIPGNVDGIIEITLPEGTCNLKVPDIPPGRYFIKAAVSDICGNISNFSTIGTFETITDEDYLTILDGTGIQNGSRELSALLEYHGSRDISFFRYRLLGAANPEGGCGPPLTDWAETCLSEIRISIDSGLEEGLYRFEAEGQCTDGTLLDPVVSKGVIIDNTRPEIREMHCSSFTSDMSVDMAWEIIEARGLGQMDLSFNRYLRDVSGALIPETIEPGEDEGVIQYKKKFIGSVLLNPVLENHGSRIEIPSDEDALNGDLYELILSVNDRAGNHGISRSMTVLFDDTAPEVPGISDPGDYINPALDPLIFQLYGLPSDGQSGITAIHWQLLQGGAGIIDSAWIPFFLEPSKSEILIKPPETNSLIEREPCFLALKAVNGAGLERIVYSDGIVPDRSKPRLARVRLNDGLISTESDRVLCAPEGTDIGGQITKIFWRFGFQESGDWIWNEEEERAIQGNESFSLILPQGLGDSTLFQFEFTLQDGAGQRSLPCHSRILYFRPEASKIVDFRYQSSGGMLNFSWESESGSIPFCKHEIELSSGEEILYSEELSGLLSSGSIPLPEEGKYTLSIKSSNTAMVSSVFKGGVLIDITAPEIDLLEQQRFVSRQLPFAVFLSDDLSPVERWHYRLGAPGDPGCFSSGWIEQRGISGLAREIVRFDELAGSTAIEDGDRLLLELAACDGFGNWSGIISGLWSLVDWTAPENIVVKIHPQIMRAGSRIFYLEDNYLTDQTTVRGIVLEAADEESGVSSYDYYITAGDDLPRGEIRTISLDKPEKVIHLEGVKAEGNTFIDGEECRVHLAFRNQAGVVSDWVTSTPVKADFTMPTVDAEWGKGFSETAPGGERIVVNGEILLKLSAGDQISEAVAADVRLYSSSNTLLSSFSPIWSDFDQEELIKLEFPQDEWGLYTLEIIARDCGGNEWPEPQRTVIRYNAPPVLHVPEVLKTFPGAELRLDGSQWGFYDADGMGRIRYTLSSPDFFQILTPTDSLFEVRTRLFHNEEKKPVTAYDLDCWIEDSRGQGTSYAGRVEVINTECGALNVDETWSGIHKLTGPVIVSDGIRLTLTDGTEVLCLAGGDSEPDFEDEEQTCYGGLRVEPLGELLHQGTVVYTSGDEGGFWSGIRLAGTAKLSNLRIHRARRGLVVEETAELDTISHCEFSDNLIGLHLFKEGLKIEGCSFFNNRYYGIKEDYPMAPELSGSFFYLNGWDYYDTLSTVRKIDE